MDAWKALIIKIFNNSTLIEVPFFQRSYVWKEDLWERFLEDMEYVVRTNSEHFLGSIILKEGEKPDKAANYAEHLTVVDGQQRLTTLLLFLKVLCLKTGQTDTFDSQYRILGEEIALRHGKNDYDAFEAAMAMEKAEIMENPAPGSRIIEAFNYFVDHIDENKLHYMTIVKNVEFVRIDLDEDEDEQQIFDTINSLGVNLTTSELLKNYFFSRETITDYEKKWANVFEKDDDSKAYWDTEIDVGRTKRALIDIFFDAYFQLFIQDKRYNISNEDKTAYERVDKLAQSYQHFINHYCGGNKDVVLDQLKDYATCFRETFRPEYCKMHIPATSGIERLNVVIFGLKTSTMIPYVLFITKNVYDEEERNKMYGILEAYIMRRMVVHATTKNYNRLFTLLIRNTILTADDLSSRLNNDGDATTYVPDDAELLDGFQKSKLVNLQSKGIIYLIETYLRPSSSSTTLLGFNQYSLEHLMPKKWRNNWEACETEEAARWRDSTLLTLGNLAIITQSLNASIRDSNWTTKKAGNGDNKPGLDLCAGGIVTMFDVLEKDTWTESDINDRAKWLYDKAKDLWIV